ncbi:amino acid ABC transporter substrate-binding protein [Secundilactobacillus malefermentans]|uniref:amino acid ABC transporter substrate-binding protein n=1 Tax=Secundilactobacillus malefermentans TaxID=176292 RepID=UPI0011CBEF87|nr:amino acid ABC transporter substrate-binding protein [Secundilactobacillus malefermentans]QEA32194.1 amino acid ABC transporter substrate-binding protein [Secundilactobacillus malefermentans]
MKKITAKLIKGFALLAIVLSATIMTGCSQVGKRADQQDNWSKINKAKKVTVGLDDSFVPMGFRQKSGNLVGYDVDLARAVFKLYHIKVSFQTIDWSMNATELKNGTIDLIWNGYTKTPEREKKVAFSTTYLRNNQTLVSLRKDKIKSLKDMKGKSLGVQTGSSGANDISTYPSLLKNRIKGNQPILYDSFTNAFIDLNAGRIQGLLIDSTYADYYVKHEADPSKYRIISTPFPKEEFGVGLRKSDTTLKRKIDDGLKVLAKNGTLNSINKKWFGNDVDSPLVAK